jgi:ammonia channel protein AmtB
MKEKAVLNIVMICFVIVVIAFFIWCFDVNYKNAAISNAFCLNMDEKYVGDCSQFHECKLNPITCVNETTHKADIYYVAEYN